MLGVAELVHGGCDLEGARHTLQAVEWRREPQGVDLGNVAGDEPLVGAVGRDHGGVQAVELDHFDVVGGRMGSRPGVMQIVDVLGPLRREVDPRGALAMDAQAAQQHRVMRSQ